MIPEVWVPAAEHNRRVAELLEANSREVARRRAAEADSAALREMLQGATHIVLLTGAGLVELEKLRADLRARGREGQATDMIDPAGSGPVPIEQREG